MRIAVTYDNGEVFQHFGRTEAFKIFDVEDEEIISSEIKSSDGAGHEALAAVLKAIDVDTLICGGIGDGAQEALASLGIEVVSGATGDADKAVKAFLKGELVSAGVNCDHHEEEEESLEGCGSCGGSCGSCGGGCHAPRILYEGPNAGKTCKVHYVGTFNDGTEFDSSYTRGEPLEFVCGAGRMIKGFDMAVLDMKVGDVKNIHLMPEEAYGMPDPEAIFTVNISELPGSEELSVGDRAYLSDYYGRPIPVLVTDKNDKTITFDSNHEMAGKELNFKIELVEVD